MNEEEIKIWNVKINEDDAIGILKNTLEKFEVRGSELYMVKKSIKYILSAYKEVVKVAKKYKNMYKAEHEIHLVRNEQLDRKENAVAKCNELIIENARLKEENERKTEKIENQKAALAILNDKQKDYNKLQNTVKSWKGQYKRLQKENNKLKEYTKINENELTFDVDCDWDALQKALDETEKSNEYIVYDNEKWIKEKYCVPIQEIKDIIEELEEKMFCEQNVRVLVQLYKQKQILLELLERRK